jgi:hypothetical protein
MFNVALLLPLSGVTVIQAGTPLTVQAAQLLEIVAVALPAVADQLKVVGDTVSVLLGAAACVTLMVWVMLHPLTMSVAVRAAPVLAW